MKRAWQAFFYFFDLSAGDIDLVDNLVMFPPRILGLESQSAERTGETGSKLCQVHARHMVPDV